MELIDITSLAVFHFHLKKLSRTPTQERWESAQTSDESSHKQYIGDPHPPPLCLQLAERNHGVPLQLGQPNPDRQGCKKGVGNCSPRNTMAWSDMHTHNCLKAIMYPDIVFLKEEALQLQSI